MPQKPSRLEWIVSKTLQRFWRLSRGLTMGAQGLVLDADDRVLLIRHGYRKGWFFPGGGVEKNETINTALTRELEEETGVVLTAAPELLGIFANFRSFPSDHIALFLVRNWDQPSKPKPNAEIAEHGFFAINDLPEGTSRGTRARLAEHFNAAPRDHNW